MKLPPLDDAHTLPLHANAHLNTLQTDTDTTAPTHVIATTDDHHIELLPAHSLPATVIYDLFRTASDRSFEYCSWNALSTVKDVHDYQQDCADDWGDKYEYAIFVNNEPVGVTYISVAHDSCIFGLWLHNDHWGRGISGLRADITIHLAFLCLDLNSLTVGCLDANTNSQRAIEKYVHRYNGTYYGSPLVKQSNYTDDDGMTPHHEYIITAENFHEETTGIDCSIPGIDYNDITFS